MKYILGTKLMMTQVFTEQGDLVPVTVVKVGPCVVTQVRTVDVDGYSAVQVGYGLGRKCNKPLAGHLKDLGVFRFIREFRIKDKINVSCGDQILVSTFSVGDKIVVTGTSKGRGFQGVVKRHHFGGGKVTHGNKDQIRMPGSLGATQPKHVFKGMRMGGHMGSQSVTVSNLKVIKVDVDNGLLYVKGAVPGARNSLLYITGNGEQIFVPKTTNVLVESVIENSATMV